MELEYITTDISLRALSEKYGVSKSTVEKHSTVGKWQDKRKKHRGKVTAKARNKIGDREAEKLAKVIKATEDAAGVIADLFSDPEQFQRFLVQEGSIESGLNTVEKKFDKRDTRALKEAVAALKDTTTLLREFYGLPTQKEKDAQKIAAERLKLDKQKVAAQLDQGKQDNEITVVFEGAGGDYAE